MGREQLLADVFVELAGFCPGKSFDLDGYLERFAGRCVQLLDVSAAVVLCAPPGERLRAVAASEADPALAGLLDAAPLEGPARESYRTAAPVAPVDLTGTAVRWPRFTEQARAAGYRFAGAVPLARRGQADGSVLLLSAGSVPVPETEVRLGQAMARVVAVTLCRQDALDAYRRINDQLRTALQSRVVIEQAKGFLAHRTGSSLEEAFEAMRGHARRHGRRLRDVARDVVERALMPEP
ncbi:transcriptional regulator [Streptomyces sp. Ru73]|uniref:GAF and ANTAR domain-containing protein n=1 Tax=Streptomyces sp. Ru73 TaxID=2080748 RepID=UPI000CDE09E8|nr:GAF and ANTAR domain-containing protein [Streptomyces sp. Ru73]POX38903.1 transcriptional regulator [Streptomyces sp. Ru73]